MFKIELYPFSLFKDNLTCHRSGPGASVNVESSNKAPRIEPSVVLDLGRVRFPFLPETMVYGIRAAKAGPLTGSHSGHCIGPA